MAIIDQQATAVIQEIQALVKKELGFDSFPIATSTGLGYELMPQKFDWKKQVHNMKPHYEGFMSDAIRNAFPRENESQRAYRHRIYASPTKASLNQAILDVNRCVMGERFTLHFGEATQKELETRLEYCGSSLLGYFMTDVYPQRVIDPNAVLCVIPDVDSIEDSKSTPIKVELWVFNSQDIVYMCDDLVIVKDENTGLSCYQVFTKNLWASVEILGGGINLLSYYEHLNNDLGVSVLGGKKRYQTYKTNMLARKNDNGQYQETIKTYFYESDFAFALSAMTNTEVLDNQNKVLVNTEAFPILVTAGLECTECNGRGKIQARDGGTGELKTIEMQDPNEPMFFEHEEIIWHTCPSCNGKKTLSLGTMDVVQKPQTKAVNPDIIQNQNLQNEVLSYISPPTDNLNAVYGQFKDTFAQMEETLNIARPSKFAESGISKDKDRESKYTMLDSIATDLERLISDTCKSIIKYLFFGNESTIQNELKALLVKRPISYDIESLSELQTEYDTNIEQKPISLRYALLKRITEKKFGQTSNEVKVLELAKRFTKGNFLRTKQEILDLQLQGIISKEAAFNYLNAESTISDIFADSGYQVQNQDAFFAKVRKALQDEYKLVTPPIAPQIPS